MPLDPNAKPGGAGFSHNVATEVRAGKPEKQAVAIAYREARADADDVASLEADLSDAQKKLRSGTLSAEDTRKQVKLIQNIEARLDRARKAQERRRADALQPSPFASRLTAFEVGLDYLSSRLDALAAGKN